MNRYLTCSFALIALVVQGTSASLAQAPKLLHDDFAAGAGTWQGVGGTVTTSIPPRPLPDRPGAQCLKLEYTVGTGTFSAYMRPIVPGDLTTDMHIKFAVLADVRTSLVIMLREDGGGRYQAAFAAPANTWQQVDLAPADFTLQDGPNDPKDPDGKLDIDKVNVLSLIDLQALFAQDKTGAIGKALGIRVGPHTMYISPVTVEPAPAAPTKPKTPLILDTYSEPQVNSVGINVTSLSKGTGKPLDGPFITMQYHQTKAIFSGVFKMLRKSVLASTTRMAFTVASQQSAKLLVEIEQDDGAKFNTVIDAAGGLSPQQMEIGWSQLFPPKEAANQFQRLDPARATKMTIVDVTGLANGQDGLGNTLTLSPITVR